MSFDFSVKFKAVDNISKKIDLINAKMNTMSHKAGEVSSKVKAKLGAGFTARFKLRTKEALNKINRLREKAIEAKKQIKDIGRKAVIGGTVVLAGIGASINTARKYELAFKDVKKALDGTPEQLAEVRKKMKEFKGATFEELGAIMSEAGKAGISIEKSMEFSGLIVRTAKALDFGAEEAIAQMGKILTLTNQMDTAIQSADEMSDMVTHLENKMSNVKAGDVLNIWSRNADMYNELRFENKDMAGISGFIAQNFSRVEIGASSFMTMMNRFKRLEGEFGFVTRIKEKGLNQGMVDVMGEIAKMSPEEQIKKFGSQAMKMISKLLISENMDKLKNSIMLATQSGGAREREWAIFRATFDERLKDMNKNLSNASDTVGNLFTPVATIIVGAFSKVFNSISEFVKENPKLAKVIGYTITIMAILAVVLGTVAVAMWAVSVPVLGVIAGIALLVAGIVALAVYWDDIMSFIFGDNQFETWGDMVRGVFDALTAPIRLVIQLIDWFLSKFEIYNKAKAAITDASGRAWDWVKNKTGFGDDDEGTNANVSAIDNTVKNHSVIDVNVTATGGAKAETATKSESGVNLRNIDNGIS